MSQLVYCRFPASLITVTRKVLVSALLWQLAAPAQQLADSAVHPKLIPTLWVQTSEEWRAVCVQSFRLATHLLDQALRDKKWTAAVEQQDKYRNLPPAVVLDIDETVLDNSPSQAREVRRGGAFEATPWAQWVSESAANAIPGAVEFCRYAASRKVAIFMVSNRDAPMETATRLNLTKLGFPNNDFPDSVLLRGEKPEWTSDKGTRRAWIASTHRILLLIGDDLGDFLSGVRTTVENRRALTDAHADKWGRRWIMIPNPSYGSWEDAVYPEPRPETPAERLTRKLERLRTQ